MIKSKSSLLLALLLWTPLVSWSQTTIFDEEKFDNVVAKMEFTVREMAREVERLYAFRCDEETITSCEAANYENCQSEFPNPQCPVGSYFKVEACGNLGSCSSQWDITTSSTRIPTELATGVDRNPTDPKVIETLCFTRSLDTWFVQKRKEDLSFWQSLGIASPPSMYFGSNNGAFRIFPARHTDGCGLYDPRTRPWYVAASSGPKNIIMVLDVSGSMEDRLSLLKQAAKRVVETLTVQDRITIIPFASDAPKIADPNGHMFRATAENIAILSKKIDDLKARGQTNFYDAFEAAFDVFDATIEEELHANCNSAILFLTDGERTEGPDTNAVTELIQDGIAMIKARLNNKPILLFTYSISDDELVHEYPSQLACAVEQGVWSRISSDDEIIDSLSSYYQLFALGLGSDSNSDFVAWVEPYEFFSGSLGTTVSVPVYDRTKSPPLFLGVVAVDIPIAAIDAALGAGGLDSAQVRAESISRVVSSSRVTCPLLDLDECELEAYGSSGSCQLNCTADQLVQVEEEACPGRPDYPSNFWANVDVARFGYSNRTCCSVDEPSESGMCPASTQSKISSNLAIILGSVAGGIVALGFTAYVYQKFCKKVDRIEGQKPTTTVETNNRADPTTDENTAGSVEWGTIPIMPPPPPRNPHCKPDVQIPAQ